MYLMPYCMIPNNGCKEKVEDMRPDVLGFSCGPTTSSH